MELAGEPWPPARTAGGLANFIGEVGVGPRECATPLVEQRLEILERRAKMAELNEKMLNELGGPTARRPREVA